MAAVDLFFSEPDAVSEAGFARAVACLDDAERARAARFRFERDRRLYVVAHALLRRALAERLGIQVTALGFTYNAHGRPELDETLHPGTELRFSLAHAHGMAVCALTHRHDIGVDVEPIDRELPWSVAERCFASSELEDLRCQPDAARPERFFTYWTLKEAYVKARGIGLSLPVERAAFGISTHGIDFRPDPKLEPVPSAWRFEAFRIGATHRVALAVRADTPVRVILRGS